MDEQKRHFIGDAKEHAGDTHTSRELLPQELIDQYMQDVRLQLAGFERLLPLAALGSAEALHTVITQAHKLRGTANIYGFPSVAVAMAIIEDVLTASPPLPELEWNRVDQAVALAKAVVG